MTHLPNYWGPNSGMGNCRVSQFIIAILRHKVFLKFFKLVGIFYNLPDGNLIFQYVGTFVHTLNRYIEQVTNHYVLVFQLVGFHLKNHQTVLSSIKIHIYNLQHLGYGFRSLTLL